MDKQAIIEFFDRRAPKWDAEMVRSDEIIGIILDNAGVTAGKDVLDVACGTGVLIPDYLKRSVSSVTAVDISPAMAETARAKFPQENVTVICGDAETEEFGKLFDCIVVYNAFPHFPEPDRLIARLSSFLKPHGTLTVAHGSSREKVNSRHMNSADGISSKLMSADELAAVFEKTLTVTAAVSDDRMFQVVGTAKK